jgi:hypothetical protein
MKIFYSASTGGFYNDAINKVIPADAVAITTADHAALIRAQSNGRVICPDATGRPIARTPPLPTTEQAAAVARKQRDSLLRACDWTALPDVSEATRAAWTAYRQALRDVTSQPNFPQSIDWPAAPI